MNETEMLEHLKAVLGSPRRYAYVSNPVTLYLNVNGNIEPKKYYSVSFVKACDLFDISDARGPNRITNPYLLNVQEPNTDGTELNSFLSHSVLLDEDTFYKLYQHTNREGNLRRFDGVVDGYSVQDMQKIFNNMSLVDTGLCISDGVIANGLLKASDIPFDEKKHTRYIQASESYEIKLQRNRTALAQPEMFTTTKFNAMFQYN